MEITSFTPVTGADIAPIQRESPNILDGFFNAMTKYQEFSKMEKTKQEALAKEKLKESRDKAKFDSEQEGSRYDNATRKLALDKLQRENTPEAIAEAKAIKEREQRHNEAMKEQEYKLAGDKELELQAMKRDRLEQNEQARLEKIETKKNTVKANLNAIKTKMNDSFVERRTQLEKYVLDAEEAKRKALEEYNKRKDAVKGVADKKNFPKWEESAEFKQVEPLLKDVKGKLEALQDDYDKGVKEFSAKEEKMLKELETLDAKKSSGGEFVSDAITKLKDIFSLSPKKKSDAPVGAPPIPTITFSPNAFQPNPTTSSSTTPTNPTTSSSTTPTEQSVDFGYGKRTDGTFKGKGYLGEIKLPNGAVATEYTVGVEVDGKEVEIPTLVPTLSKEQIHLMKTDIIPNGKKVPKDIMKLAVEHAMMRLKTGKSVFADISAEDIEKAKADAVLRAEKAKRRDKINSALNQEKAISKDVARDFPDIAELKRKEMEEADRLMREEDKKNGAKTNPYDYLRTK